MPEYTKEDCIRETLDHIQKVRDGMGRIISDLAHRAEVHDASKMKSPELEVFIEYTPKLKTSTYGSDEYKENLKGMKVALDHHYANNSHHPEYYQKHVCDICFTEYKDTPPNRCHVCLNGTFTVEPDISQMSLPDIVEMLCDWYAATLRHADGDIMKSIEMNQKRFKYSDELKQILINTMKYIDPSLKEE